MDDLAEVRQARGRSCVRRGRRQPPAWGPEDAEGFSDLVDDGAPPHWSRPTAKPARSHRGCEDQDRSGLRVPGNGEGGSAVVGPSCKHDGDALHGPAHHPEMADASRAAAPVSRMVTARRAPLQACPLSGPSVDRRPAKPARPRAESPPRPTPKPSRPWRRSGQSPRSHWPRFSRPGGCPRGHGPEPAVAWAPAPATLGGCSKFETSTWRSVAA